MLHGLGQCRSFEKTLKKVLIKSKKINQKNKSKNKRNKK
jgi:hypothetical protein